METRKEKLMIMIVIFFFMISLFSRYSHQTDGNIPTSEDKVIVHVGLILEMTSMEGKILHSCITMALSDFYDLNIDYRTRIVLHTRDSKGETLLALSAGKLPFLNRVY